MSEVVGILAREISKEDVEFDLKFAIREHKHIDNKELDKIVQSTLLKNRRNEEVVYEGLHYLYSVSKAVDAAKAMEILKFLSTSDDQKDEKKNKS